MPRPAEHHRGVRFRRIGLTALFALSPLLSALVVTPSSAASETARSPHAQAQSSEALVLSRINALRRKFHLPLAVMDSTYSAAVSVAALKETDPVLPHLGGKAVEAFGVWGIAPFAPPPSSVPASAILNAWVYHDGWEGSNTTNVDCTRPTAPGCNAHRRAILSTLPRPGAKLYADIAVTESNYEGGPGTSVAVLMIWLQS